MKYEVQEIRIDEIDTSGRLRPVDRDDAEALAALIEAEGLRSPIEVAPVKAGKFKYKLSFGGHRTEAFRILGRETIPAFVRDANELARRRSEIMENVGRKELSALELATFLAELKRVEQALRGARRGGDRVSEKARSEQNETLSVWYGEMAQIRRKTPRTIAAYVAIGENLSDDTVSRLRGTPFEDRQSELKELAIHGAAIQSQIVDLLLADKGAPPTVRSARARLEGRPDEADTSADDRMVRALLDDWKRAPKRVKKRFFDEIKGEAESW